MVQANSRAMQVWIGRAVLAVLLLGAWQFTSGRYVDPFWLSSPGRIAERLVLAVQSGQLVRDVTATFSAFLMGFAGGIVSGVTLAALGSRFEKVVDALLPYLTALYSLPKVALVPLFLLWFGIGIESKVALVWFITIFIAFWNAYLGIRNVDRQLIDMARIMGASELHILWKIQLPSTVSWIVTSMKIGVPLALHGAIAAELFGANQGLGFSITYAASKLDTTGVLAMIAVVVVISAMINALLNALQVKLDKWR